LVSPLACDTRFASREKAILSQCATGDAILLMLDPAAGDVQATALEKSERSQEFV